MTRRTAVALASLILVVACGSGSSSPNGTFHTDSTQPAVAPTPTSASFVGAVKARQRAAVAYAAHLAASAPQLPGEKPFTATPPENMRHVDETIGVGNLVVRARYWIVRGSPHDVYEALSGAPPAGFRLTGYGDPTSRAEDVAGRGFVHFDPITPPSYIDSCELYIEMEAGTNGHTIIASFGEASAHPIRTPAETIPAAGSKVTVMRERTIRPAEIVNRVPLDAADSAAFVHAFDTSPVRAPGVCIGGIPGPYAYRIVIVSGGRTWQITYPGGANCGGFGVRLGTESLPDLEPSTTMRHLIVADYLGGDGFISGSLGTVRGSDDGLHALKQGTVTAVRNGRAVALASVVGQMGVFELEAPPGRYTLTGTSPKYEGGAGVCHGYKAVTVRANQSVSVKVLCPLR